MTERKHPHELHVYQDVAGRWRWRCVARNHRTVGASEQGYRFRWYAARKGRQAHPDAELVNPAD